MWNFLGDFKEPYGTYYRSAADTFNPYWHIYDQVIIRPSLRSRFVDGNLKIITGSANVSLLDKNKHPNHSISDHLPITFEIKEDYQEFLPYRNGSVIGTVYKEAMAKGNQIIMPYNQKSRMHIVFDCT